VAAESISPDALLQLVRAFYVELHHVEPEPNSLALDSRLENDLGFDSLARVELLLRLEQRFGIHLSEADAAQVERVTDLLAALNRTAGTAGSTVLAGRTAAPADLHRPSASTGRLPPPQDATTLQRVLLWRAEHDATETHLSLLTEQGAQPLSYQDLLAGAERIAQGLQQHGIGPESTVALMLPTSFEFFWAFFGALLAGAVPVPIYPPARPSQLEEHVRRHARILDNAQVEALVTVPEAAAVSRLLQLRVPTLHHIFSASELADKFTAPLATPLFSPESLALLQYTSGSTGSPKGVMLTHRNLLADIQAMGRHVHASAEDVLVSWLPLYHDMGLIGSWLASLYFGCRFIVMSPMAFLARPGLWLRAIHDYRGTISGSPNFGYELAARRAADADLAGLDLSCWRVAINGAEPVMPETLEHFRVRFGPLGFRREAMTPVYGLAEAAVGVTFPPPGRGPVIDSISRERFMRSGRAEPAPPTEQRPLRFVSCGAPLREFQVRIVDEAGSEVPERLEGKVQFTGPSATEGYYRNAEATARLRSGSWRDTGDRGYMAAGELFLTGRSKDLIIRRGRHIYPEEIEGVIGELPYVRKGCVVAFGSVDPHAATERLIIVAETYSLNALQRSELIKSINQCVMQCVGEPPEEIVLAAPHSVLKTSSGKLRRADTRAAYEHGSLQQKSTRARQLWRLTLETFIPFVRRAWRSGTRVAYGLYAWGTFLLLGIPIAIVTVIALSGARAWQLTHRAAAWLIRAWLIPESIQWQGDPSLPKPNIIVVNHCSYLDGLFVAALLSAPHRFVASFSWQTWPLLNRYLGKLETILFPHSGARDALSELRQMTDALACGSSLVVFPEATFTRAAGLRPFRLGAFEAAVEAGVPVVAVALRGTRSLLRDGQSLMRRGAVQIVVSAPYSPPVTGNRFDAAVQMRALARAHIAKYCGEPELS
jgi:acyl carrier protein